MHIPMYWFYKVNFKINIFKKRLEKNIFQMHFSEGPGPKSSPHGG